MRIGDGHRVGAQITFKLNLPAFAFDAIYLQRRRQLVALIQRLGIAERDQLAAGTITDQAGGLEGEAIAQV
jgi:hypothetical protein